MSDSFWPQGLQHTRLPCPSPSHRVSSNSCPLSWWYHPMISTSVFPFSSRLQSFPERGFFPMSWLFASGGQSIGISASASVLRMTIQDWFPLGLPSMMSLQSKGLSRVFSKTSVRKHLWGVRREGGSGWGTHVDPRLIHVKVWQKPLQYCKVISLQLIKINGKKKRKHQFFSAQPSLWINSHIHTWLLEKP